jgi:hypothetical protein
VVRVSPALLLGVLAGCNSLLGIEDLTLVDAVPLDAQATFSVREGEAGYALTKDTFIGSAAPTTAHGDDADLQWNSTGELHAMLRFDDLFGTGGIPSGKTIQMATLEVTVLEAGSANGKLYEARNDWDETTTYNTMGSVTGVTSADDLGTQVDTLDGSALGKATITVTTTIARWSQDPTTNKGWIIVPASDGMLVRIASSDDPNVENRPKLTVEIVP